MASPIVCGDALLDGGVPQACDGGATTITGTVVAGTDPSLNFGQPDPIYGAIVYVPSGAVQGLTTGATCDQCTTQQPAIASAVTGVDGTFTLTNPPTGANVTVVIQLGKWRRVLTVDVAPCVNNALTTAQTRLPRKQQELNPNDNIPRFAISTGNVDVLECVLRKMGIDDTEFTDPDLDAFGNPQATGRVHVYQANYDASNGAGGAIIDTGTPSDSLLWSNPTTIDAYDAVLFPCTGGEDDKDPADLSGDPACPECFSAQHNVMSYADMGGRIFATHFSYVWLYDDPPWGCGPNCTVAGQTTADWDPDTLYNDSTAFTGFIDQSFAKGAALAQWLKQAAVGASTTLGQIPVDVVRKDFTSLVGAAQRWMYATHPPDQASFPMHYTFNTPANASPANQCGRVVFSDFHVENVKSSKNETFPKECDGDSPMTPQEKLLEFMLFDLTSCVSPDVPTCTARTCAELGFDCGMQGDGCGNTLDCGTCQNSELCGGGGAPGVCATGCTAKTCAELGFSCGMQGDGCGNTLDCGMCTSPQSCGGGGTPGVCGGGCVALTCVQQGFTCGSQGNGCGGGLQCGECTLPDSCGGGGVPGQCGGATCVAATCGGLGLSCGPAGDGCGGSLDCGTCPTGETCGGGGISGQCGSCAPETCGQQGFGCGQQGDGCGGMIQCGDCPAGETCGGGGIPNQCGGGCMPLSCAQQGLSCGSTGDGCGGSLDCGACPMGESCGGGGMSGQCGVAPDGATCLPLTCVEQGLACGAAGDGCGDLLACGDCPMGETCGGGGTPGQCGAPNCKPRTCDQAMANCGVIGDGCGGIVDCGMCTPPETCGGEDVPNQCGSLH